MFPQFQTVLNTPPNGLPASHTALFDEPGKFFEKLDEMPAKHADTYHTDANTHYLSSFD
jgi:hypothetical protein